ncbi:MAG TPA: hypothetical protein VEH84_17115 [Alphaproteobacteria bacterium]|nr:hypothetical protein [Alphaproteobacteria bacterium]
MLEGFDFGSSAAMAAAMMETYKVYIGKNKRLLDEGVFRDRGMAVAYADEIKGKHNVVVVRRLGDQPAGKEQDVLIYRNGAVQFDERAPAAAQRGPAPVAAARRGGFKVELVAVAMTVLVAALGWLWL